MNTISKENIDLDEYGTVMISAEDVKNTIQTYNSSIQLINMVHPKGAHQSSIVSDAYENISNLMAAQIDEFIISYSQLLWDENQAKNLKKLGQTNMEFFHEAIQFIVFFLDYRDNGKISKTMKNKLNSFDYKTSTKKFSNFLSDFSYDLENDLDVNKFM